MYLYLGSDTVVRSDDVIGIFDIEKASVNQNTKDYLSSAGRRKSAVYVSYDMPKSFTVTVENGKERVYISNVSAFTLKKRGKDLSTENR